MEIAQADNEHIEMIQHAFDRQRESRDLYYAGYLAQPEISDFHRDRICERVRKRSYPNFNLYIDKGELIAIAGIEYSSWHSKHFGLAYYKIQPFYCFGFKRETPIPFFTTFRQSLVKEYDGLFSIRIGAHEHTVLYELQKNGFIQVGTSARFSLQNNKKQVDTLPSAQYDSLEIRDFQKDDLPAVKRIAIENHNFSHFYQEVRFSRDSVKSIFGKWIERCSEGMAKKILVAEHNGQTVGFAALLTNEALVPYIRDSQQKKRVLKRLAVIRLGRGNPIGFWHLTRALVGHRGT